MKCGRGIVIIMTYVTITRVFCVSILLFRCCSRYFKCVKCKCGELYIMVFCWFTVLFVNLYRYTRTAGLKRMKSYYMCSFNFLVNYCRYTYIQKYVLFIMFRICVYLYNIGLYRKYIFTYNRYPIL